MSPRLEAKLKLLGERTADQLISKIQEMLSTYENIDLENGDEDEIMEIQIEAANVVIEAMDQAWLYPFLDVGYFESTM